MLNRIKNIIPGLSIFLGISFILIGIFDEDRVVTWALETPFTQSASTKMVLFIAGFTCLLFWLMSRTWTYYDKNYRKKKHEKIFPKIEEEE